MSSKPDTETLLNQPVEELLPHTQPMVLIDKILSLNENTIVCQTSFSNKEAFFKNSVGVPSPWAVEIIAQACALFVSITQYGTGISQGRLLKCRSFSFESDVLPYNQTFTVTAELKLAGDSGLWIFDGSLKNSHSHSLAQGDMSILVQ